MLWRLIGIFHLLFANITQNLQARVGMTASRAVKNTSVLLDVASDAAPRSICHLISYLPSLTGGNW